MAYYRQPEFYRNFKCMGGECPNTCCANWRIDWTKEEVEKLKSSDCSVELRKLIDESFVYSDDDHKIMNIKFKNDNCHDCPFLTDDKMCRIQRELGEEHLSMTCRTYPRIFHKSGNVVFRTCSASCFQVLEMLKTDENAMDIFSAPLESEKVTLRAEHITKALLQSHPEMKYYNELFSMFYEIISNKKRSIETSLIIGALAAQKITEFIKCGEFDRIPEIIKTLRPQLNTTAIPSFEKTKLNYGISLGLVAEIANSLVKTNILDSLKEGEKLSAGKYEYGKSIFSEFTEQYPHFLRNIALNFYFQGKFPYMDTNLSLFENYCYYVSTIAVVKLSGCAVAARDKSMDKFNIPISFFVRSMYHTKNSCANIYNILKKNEVSTPAKLSLMLK